MDSSYPCYQRTTTKNQEIGGVKECRITNKDYKLILNIRIHYLSQEIMRLTQENAMLKAYIQENKENQQCAEEE